MDEEYTGAIVYNTKTGEFSTVEDAEGGKSSLLIEVMSHKIEKAIIEEIGNNDSFDVIAKIIIKHCEPYYG